MRILASERLSQHRFKTPEGYLVCTDAILARTGKQTYHRKELWGDSCNNPDDNVDVMRDAKEVFSDATLASFENKPVTVEHPNEDVTAENHNDYAVGFVRDVHQGKVDGQDVMLGTLIITDAKTINEIENGEHTELSCGYDCDIDDSDNPQQRNIRGNHVALCQQGRAGIARIVDSKVKDKNMLPKDKRRTLENYLSDLSSYVNDVFKIENIIAFLRSKGFNVIRERTNGWNKIGKEMMRKDNYLKVEGFDDTFVISMYATPYGYCRTDTYFTDSIKEDIMKDDTYPEYAIWVKKDGKWLIYGGSNTANINRQAYLAKGYDDVKVMKNDGQAPSKRDSMNDARFTNQTKQGYQVIETYRDGGRLHVIFKRANDYGVGLGYDELDGQWAQGMYDYRTLDDAREALKETKPYARRIVDAVEDSTEYEDLNCDIDKYSMNVRMLEGIVDAARRTKGLSDMERQKIIMRANGLIADLKRMGDSVKDARWEVGNRVRYNGEWYYVINHLKGEWILENESDRSQIRVADSGIRDSFFVKDSLKSFSIRYVKDGNTYIKKVKAKTLEDAIKKIKAADELYTVSYIGNGVNQVIAVKANSADEAKQKFLNYAKSKNRTVTINGISEGAIMKPGLPILDKCGMKDSIKVVDVVKTVKDAHLSPSTYKALKELGVTPEQWSKMTQQQASEYIAKRKTASGSKTTKSNKAALYEKHIDAIKARMEENLNFDGDSSDIEFELSADEYNSDEFWSKLNNMFEQNEVSFNNKQTTKRNGSIYVYGRISRYDK